MATPPRATQRDRLATHLRQWGGINADSARRLGIGQVRTRVLELRRLGWQITTMPPLEGSHGAPIPGRYVLVQAPDEPARTPGLGL